VAGRGDGAAAVFYAISRLPDLWAAGLALGGSPQPAIDSDRLFTANFTNAPVLWVHPGGETLAGKLQSDGLNVVWRSPAGMTNGALLEWLAGHSRDEFPLTVDCETNSPIFARCYWIQMTKFDPNERNDVLPTTHLAPSNGAALNLGGFGFKPDDPGPGLLVSYLPEKYSGPLKMGDRIVEMGGRSIADARQFAALMSKVTEEAPVVVMVQRGKDRVRMETQYIVPRRPPLVTARVQAKYVPEEKSMQIISRTITEMRVTIPPQWAPLSLLWNGLTMQDVETPGCYLLKLDKELLHSSPCP
jgi:hypothetical protein